MFRSLIDESDDDDESENGDVKRMEQFTQIKQKSRILKEQIWILLHKKVTNDDDDDDKNEDKEAGKEDNKNTTPIYIREFYSHSSVIYSFCLLVEGKREDAMREIDLALLVGGNRLRNHILQFIDIIDDELSFLLPPSKFQKIDDDDHHDDDDNDDDDHDDDDDNDDDDDKKENNDGIKSEIERREGISIEEFKTEYMLKSKPVILLNEMNNWSAITNWKNFNYFKHVAGNRTLPIEIGSSYLLPDWSQSMMTFTQFIDEYINPPSTHLQCNIDHNNNKKTGYLAQVRLFDLIPKLRNDIAVPIFCSICDIGNEEDLAINAWFVCIYFFNNYNYDTNIDGGEKGPKGTVTPCHFDPTHNLLCQVVGSKLLRLYSPDYSDNLYSVNGMLSNNSQVDVEHPDFSKFPKFKSTPYIECVLNEGEMIYIPPKYWHYVRSLSVSFSTSFWW